MKYVKFEYEDGSILIYNSKKINGITLVKSEDEYTLNWLFGGNYKQLDKRGLKNSWVTNDFKMFLFMRYTVGIKWVKFKFF